MESTVERKFFCRVDNVGAGDLAAFRDAVLLYSEALRSKRAFYCQASPEASELLVWLGLDFLPPEEHWENQPSAFGYPSPAALPKEGLNDYRERGYLGRTLFSTLVRSSYGPDEEGFFPTVSELGFYFDRAKLRTEVRWDQDYLDECQEFFFEELTPNEILYAGLELLPASARDSAEPFLDELQGVVFLVGEQETMLAPIRELLSGLLVSQESTAVLAKLVSAVETWDTTGMEAAWSLLTEADREAVVQGVLSGHAESAVEVLAACGRRLLEWRAKG